MSLELAGLKLFSIKDYFFSTSTLIKLLVKCNKSGKSKYQNLYKKRQKEFVIKKTQIKTNGEKKMQEIIGTLTRDQTRNIR